MIEKFPSPIVAPSLKKEDNTQEDSKEDPEEEKALEEVREETVPELEERIKKLEQSMRAPTKEELSLVRKDKTLTARYSKLRQRIYSAKYKNIPDPDFSFYMTSMSVFGVIVGVGIALEGNMTPESVVVADAVMGIGVISAPAIDLFTRAVTSIFGLFAEHELPKLKQRKQETHEELRQLQKQNDDEL